MKNFSGLISCSLLLLVAACETGYGESPTAGSATLAVIEEGFVADIFTGRSPTGDPDEYALAGMYDPAPGKICIMYGVVRETMVGIPVYTAQVFPGFDETRGDYFYGTMYLYDRGLGGWERFAEYSYFPSVYPKTLEVHPYNLPAATLVAKGEELLDYYPSVEKCKDFEYEATYVPPSDG